MKHKARKLLGMSLLAALALGTLTACPGPTAPEEGEPAASPAASPGGGLEASPAASP
jgi:hypothetical protein